LPTTINEAINELRTIRDMLRWAVSRLNAAKLFYGHGTDNAWDEAVALVLHALHLPPDIDPKIIDANLLKSERCAIAELISYRILDRVPAAYLTQQAWFAGLSFFVDKRVLIPRSPIAELIEQQFAPWIESHNVDNILDLCTGSGCIAIACAKYLPNAQVDAIDISKDALAVAKINCERHQVNDQVHLIESNLFEKIKNKKYDIIVSNPPYVATAEMQTLPQE
jgi:ribosomal protein L3 glutamine methyltransferase